METKTYPIISKTKIINVLEFDVEKYTIGRTIIEHEGAEERNNSIESMKLFDNVEDCQKELDKILYKRSLRTIKTREEQLLLPYKYKVGDNVLVKLKKRKINATIYDVGSYFDEKTNGEILAYKITFMGADPLNGSEYGHGCIKLMNTVFETDVIKKMD